MKRLSILRHAKSSWDDPALDDFNRPLNERGWKASRRMGGELREKRMRFDLVLASTAARIRETVDGVQEEFDFEAPIRFEPRLYLADLGTLLALVRALPEDVKAPLLVGHNPALHQLVLNLTRSNGDKLRQRVADKYPTATFAAIELPVDRWDEVEGRAGKLVELILPRELD